jgi:hypothetical protein
MKRLFLNQKQLRLEPDSLIKSGGEGMVFDMGHLAAKIYHRPQPGQSNKLRLLMSVPISSSLPTNVLGPCQIISDENRQLAGFAMPRLPHDSQGIRQVANPNFYRARAIDTQPVVQLFQEIHDTLQRLHQLGLIVGDLNDHNIHFTMPAGRAWSSFWIDVDSYQIGSYPCPVATETFLDPLLHHLNDFSIQPSFTQATDWYAFFVLLVKSLLLAHPYGGTHRRHKSLTSRAEAGISLLHSSVTYPRLARPAESLSDDLLQHMTVVFEQGQRPPFPAHLLTQYAANLHRCSHCSLSYPKSRPGCPACRRQIPVAVPVVTRGRLRLRRLLDDEGLIVHVHVQVDGGIRAITRTGDQYQLLKLRPGAQTSRQTLFSGHQGYRFGFLGSQYLVVNPVHSRQLLLLDLGRQPVRRINLIETTLLHDRAVFACSKHHLFRQVKGMIMRGEIRDGLYLEETVATARQGQTWLWAPPLSDLVTGFYRFFDEHHFFIIGEDGTFYQMASPFPSAQGNIQEIVGLFSREEVGFLARTIQNGHHHVRAAIFDRHGHLLSSFQLTAPELDLGAELDGMALFGTTLLWATDDGIVKHRHNGQSRLAGTSDFASQGDHLHCHPDGLLIQHCSALLMATEETS